MGKLRKEKLAYL